MTQVEIFSYDLLSFKHELLEDMTEKVSKYEKILDENERLLQTRVAITRQWRRKVAADDELTEFANQTLIAIFPRAEELYSKLGSGKELLEKIGHYQLN